MKNNLQIESRMENEIWKDIPGYENYYQVSNYGRVKSLTDSNGNDRLIRIIILKQSLMYDGYKRVTFTIDRIRRQYTVHRLVAMSFILNPDNKPQVNHINGIKSDNRLENLEWCTQSENMIHAYKIGLEKPCDNGLKKGVSIILNSKIIRTHRSIREMCRKEGFDRRSVQRVLEGSISNHHGYKFLIHEK